MFTGLRKRVNSVLQEGRNLSENLSNTLLIRQQSTASSSSISSITSQHTSATLPSASTPSSKAVVLPTSDAFPYAVLNVHAGVARLAATELDWQQLHDAAVANAATADRIDADIQQIQLRAATINTHVSDMVHSLQAVPTLCAQLSECGRQLTDVRKLCERLDASLFQLEDVILDCRLHDRQLEMRVELGAYQDRKMAALDLVRVEMEKEYTSRRQQNEQRLRSVQLERQAVFQAAFQEDLRSYQQLGTIPRADRPRGTTDSATVDVRLEEIELDANRDERLKLDEFLNN